MSNPKFYDIGQFDAIRNWVLYGLRPGGCSTCIIEGDYDGAYSRAHPHLKTSTQFTFQEMYDNLRGMVPPMLLDQPSKNWLGLDNHRDLHEILLFEAGLSEHTTWLIYQITKSLTPSN